MGLYAGKSITTGSNNTALGWCALMDATTAAWNTAVGYRALYENLSLIHI